MGNHVRMYCYSTEKDEDLVVISIQTFLLNFGLSSSSFVSLGWKVRMAALTLDSKRLKHC